MTTITLTEKQTEVLGSVLMAAHKLAYDKASEASRNNKRLTMTEQYERAGFINEIMKLIDKA